MRTALAVILSLSAASAAGEVNYAKRAAPVDPAISARLLGRWTNPVDNLVIDIRSIDPTSGALRGLEWPTIASRPGSAAPGTEHELIGWISAAPQRAGADNVTPVSFSVSLFEYGTLPVWAGYLTGERLITMHYLVWPSRAYPWDHISAFQEVWTRLP
jgi:hypothetical protein